MVPVFLTACVKTLPPAPVPSQVLPPIQPAPPPPEGQARLLVDVTDGPAPVQRVQLVPRPARNGVLLAEETRPFCQPSPCAVDLPFGNVLLGFPVIGQPTETEVELVHVGPESSAYRRTLAVYTSHHTPAWAVVATSIGGASAITGTVLLPIGLSDSNSGLTMAGGITLGVGAALIAIGAWALQTNASTYRPGSSSHFALH